jgi:hypothetical protein
VVAAAAVLQLLAGITAVALVQPAAPPAGGPSEVRARIAPPHPESLQAREERQEAVEQLLADRAGALLRRDRRAFLSTVDPAATALRARQEELFEALREVPLRTWRYVLDPTEERPGEPALDRKYGRDRWWAPDVTLEYALEGFDERPVAAAHHLTFVRRAGRWLLAADDDFAPTARALWDRGPVVSERVDDVLVLGRPTARPLLRSIAQLTAHEVPRVSAVWGPGWRRGVVVLVPGSAQEMAELLGSRADLSRIAAVATAELTGASGEFAPGNDRVLVNPDTFRGLGRVGRRVVLTHELAHVATRQATGPAMPTWLAEGFADYIAYAGLDVSLAVSARELTRDVVAGRLPTRLPGDGDFSGGNPELAQAYEQAWLAARVIAEQHGQQGLVRLYRAVGARRGVPADVALQEALRQELDLSVPELTAAWRDFLQRELG